jgi:ribose transport system permease protein
MLSRAGHFIERRVPAALIMPIATALMFGVFSVFQPKIFAIANVVNVFNQSSYLALFAAAQSVVILTRGFDLSLGTAVSTVSVVTALVMTRMGNGDLAIPLGCAAGLGAAVLVGLFNGLTITVLNINPFVVTLATFNILLTVSSTISGGFPVSGLPQEFSAILGSGSISGFPIVIILTVAILIGLQVVLDATAFGRSLYIIGSNPKAARAAGIPVRFHLVGAYVMCSVLIGIGAVLLTARTGSGEPNLGGTLALQTISAAVVGGMSLRGGEGSMLAPVSGALFVTVLSNGMNLLQVNGYLQEVFLGVLVVAALCLDRLRRSFRSI